MKKSIFLVALVALFLGIASPEMAFSKSKKAKACCETAKTEKCSTDKAECKTDAKHKDACKTDAKCSKDCKTSCTTDAKASKTVKEAKVETKTKTENKK
jgi:hypothetical protein